MNSNINHNNHIHNTTTSSSHTQHHRSSSSAAAAAAAATPSSSSTTSTSPAASRPSSSSTTQACAACKYQRRKCNPDCTLAPYFPADHQHQFLNAHRLFDVSNILKIIRGLDPLRRSEAMKSIIFQSDMRAHDPVGGCYRIILDLERQYERDCHELALVLHHLSLCRQAAVQGSAADQIAPQHPTPNLLLGDIVDDVAVAGNNNVVYGNDLMIATTAPTTEQQQQQQYYDYFYFDGNGGGAGGGGENNINVDNDDHINCVAHAATTMSGNSVNNAVGGTNGNGNEVDMEMHPQPMLVGLQEHHEQHLHAQEDDVKPFIDMFDVTHALALGDEEEVGEITSKAADLDLAAGSYHCRSELELSSEIHEAKREEANAMEQVQEHDLKGAASLFTLTSRDSSFV